LPLLGQGVSANDPRWTVAVGQRDWPGVLAVQRGYGAHMSDPPVDPRDLTPDERFAVCEIGDRMAHRLFPQHITDRLRELGLIEPALGAFVLTQPGRSIRQAILDGPRDADDGLPT
jgi:hypothetical protein